LLQDQRYDVALRGPDRHAQTNLITADDELFRHELRADASADESVRDAGEANALENFAYVFDPRLEEIVMGRMDRNSDQAVKFMENAELRGCITRLIRDQDYDRIQSAMKGRRPVENRPAG
jgi:hypothetical protein